MNEHSIVSDESDSEDGDNYEWNGVMDDDDIFNNVKDIMTKVSTISHFHVPQDLHTRQLGVNVTAPLPTRVMSSPQFISRLNISTELSGHSGSVNCLHFNMSGTRLVSGSDDLSVILWSWEGETARQLGQVVTTHWSNVYSVKLVGSDTQVVSSAADGQVILTEMGGQGHRKLAQHRGPAHSLALLPHTDQCFFSAGEGGQVLLHDIRQQKPDNVVLIRNAKKSRKIALYSIDVEPTEGDLLCVGGRDNIVRVYDRRFVSKTVVEHSPPDGEESHVTCVKFGRNNLEILASYTAGYVHLFSSQQVYQYQGHRNREFIKEVSFYGPGDCLVVSGSDCGNLFIWDKVTQGVVLVREGDREKGLNVLEPHPTFPYMVTSGLDDEVKIWTITDGVNEDLIHHKTEDYMQKAIYRNLLDEWKENNIYDLSILSL